MTELDVMGLERPMPVLRTRRLLKDLSAGQEITVVSDDPHAVQDLPAFCAQAGHHLIMVHDEGGVYRFVIARAADPTEQAA